MTTSGLHQAIFHYSNSKFFELIRESFEFDLINERISKHWVIK